jgi:RNA polymerase sigma-70 factor (ECF subfamily)
METPKQQDCEEVLALLSSYLNLELPAEACAEIEEHLAGCSPCIEFAESLRQTVDLCRRFQPAALPTPIGEEARARLMAAYRKMLAARQATG